MAFALAWLDPAQRTFDDLMSQAQMAFDQRKGQGKSTKVEGLFKQTNKCIELLVANPRHPGLQTHEFNGIAHPYDRKQKVFEAYAQNRTPGAYRVFWCYGPGKNQITIIAITPHP
ncbi:MAG TPA: hypothetical protein VKK61_06065 [Tepidisphaeraceae bacterium]|nr:hypothetical protein [Tepidisphaeraceae bacterium]